MSMTALGQLVSRLRKEQGLTQRELAGRAPGLTQAYISDIERGKNERPSVEKLRDLADALGVPYNRLAVAAGFVEEQGGEAGARPKGPIEQILEDILSVTDDRPEIIRKLRVIRERDGELTYRRALRILHRQMVTAVDLAADLARDDEEGGSDGEE